MSASVRQYSRGRSLVQQPAIHRLTRAEYRLLSHISTLYSPLLDNVSHNYFLWRKGVKQFMAIAFSSDYTMHAILAWSATHLSQMTGDPKVKQQMYHHRFQAFQGLQIAVRELSLENADAALCASIVMSWQAADASTWMNLIRGSRAVKDTMTSWQCQSTLSDSTKSSDALVHSTTLFLMLFDALDHVVPVRRSDAQRILLAEAHLSLRVLQVTVSGAPDLHKAAADLTSFIESVQNEHETIISLQPLKDLLFWFPTRFIPILNTSPAVMILMAHLHAIALFVGPVDDPNSVLFRSLNVAPIEAFYEEFTTRYQTARETGDVGDLKMNEDSLRMMQFPMQAVTEFHTRTRLGGEYPTVLRRSQLRISGGDTGDAGLKTEPIPEVLERFPVRLWRNSIS